MPLPPKKRPSGECQGPDQEMAAQRRTWVGLCRACEGCILADGHRGKHKLGDMAEEEYEVEDIVAERVQPGGACSHFQRHSLIATPLTHAMVPRRHRVSRHVEGLASRGLHLGARGEPCRMQAAPEALAQCAGEAAARSIACCGAKAGASGAEAEAAAHAQAVASAGADSEAEAEAKRAGAHRWHRAGERSATAARR